VDTVNVKDIMRKKYPNSEASLIRYFTFIECERGIKQCGRTHVHHILPRAQFKKYCDLRKYPENAVILSVEKHIEAHRLAGYISAEMGMPCPKWIGIHSSKKWLAAQKAAGCKRSKDPKWRAANKAAMRKLSKDPKWLAAQKAAGCKLSKDPKWLAAMKKAQNCPEVKAKRAATRHAKHVLRGKVWTWCTLCTAAMKSS
jgi:aminoglycoside phosphotransferase